MKDELTKKMHAEFQIDAETEVKHRVFALLTLCGTENRESWKKHMEGYEVTDTDISKHLPEFVRLKNGTE